MSSRFRIEILLGAAFVLGLAACDRHDPRDAPAGSGPLDVSDTALFPANGALQPLDPRALPYYGNAEAVVAGMKLYNQYNCVGCHANGGGAIGPPLMDDAWVYGGRMDQIYNSIYQGRANGMPAWGGRLQPEEIWKMAAYVRSMSLPATLAAAGGGTPSRNPAPVPREADMDNGYRPPPGEPPAQTK
jgi:cytochrome c oxidase cbb3-type subunit 3